METQAEMTNEQRAEIEKIAAIPDTKAGSEKDKKAESENKKEPSKEEIRAAVAGVVLAEMKSWPESVVALVGEQHPNKESFLKGVAYIIGCYMHFACKGLEKLAKRRKEDAEQKTCGLLSPVAVELEGLRSVFFAGQERDIADLKKRREVARKEADRAVRNSFEKQISAVEARELPDRGIELIKREANAKEAFRNACEIIDAEAMELKSQILDIEEARGQWSSEERRAKRLPDGQSEDEAQEVTK